MANKPRGDTVPPQKKIGHLSNARIPQLADVPVSRLCYTAGGNQTGQPITQIKLSVTGEIRANRR